MKANKTAGKLVGSMAGKMVQLVSNLNPTPPPSGDITEGALQFEDSENYLQFEDSTEYLVFETT